MRKFWMAIVIMAMVLGLTGCGKKETEAPVKEEVEEEIGETEKMEETETPIEEETEESEGLEETEEEPEAEENWFE